jgi:hypothetical protein
MLTLSISESAVRARAKTRGYFLRRSRQRSTHGNNHGQFMLLDFNNRIIFGERFDATLERIADFLQEAA